VGGLTIEHGFARAEVASPEVVDERDWGFGWIWGDQPRLRMAVGGERIGVHLLLRSTPPKELAVDAEHVVCGHGAGLQ
jgi:predicted nucleotidyltransferase